MSLKGIKGVKKCCQEPRNLYVFMREGNKTTRKCKSCGCRHIEMVVDRGSMQTVGKPI
jgi:hypothetical protein